MEPKKAPTFNKEDFLTNRRVAELFKVSKENATKALKSLYLKRATIKININNKNSTRQIPAVILNKSYHHKDAFILHPMAHDLVKQELQKQETQR